MQLDYLPTSKSLKRKISKFFGFRSNNPELTIPIHTRQAFALLIVVMLLAVVAGFIELNRQDHNRQVYISAK